jgi:beta-N-acetylhexosaminidase
MKKLSILLFAIAISFSTFSQDFFATSTQANRWVDSVYKSLSKKQRIAQLMIIRAHSNLGQDHIDGVVKLIKKFNVGGLCFFQGGPVRQANLTNYYQSIAKTPLMITIDAEWGVGMRLDSVQSFPRQLMMGAMDNENTVYQFGRAVAEQCKRLGIHVNFAPVVDVNNNPNNPVINDRSFGENKFKVAKYGTAYTNGMQSLGVMACAKHFPGHGDVAVDSHLDLPIIDKTKTQLNDLELYPFKQLIDANVGSVMLAHLFLPALDTTANKASSLSPKVVNELLKSEMQYKGLTFTDALEMKGVSKFYPAGEASVQSILAGNDLLCLPGDVEGSIKKILKAVRKKQISKKELEARIKKVLLAKYNLGLHTITPIQTDNLVADLNISTAGITKDIASNAITLVKQNNKVVFPIGFNVENKDVLPKVAYISIGNGKENSVTNTLKNIWNADVFLFNNSYSKNDTIKETIEPQAGIKIIDTKEKLEQANNIINNIKINNYDVVVIGVHNYNRRPANNFGISNSAVYLLQQMQTKNNVLFSFFGNPYAIKNIPQASNVITCYEDDATTQQVFCEMLQGKLHPIGTLPVTVNEFFKMGDGIVKKKFNNEPLTTNTKLETTIDSIVHDAINQKAFPGCVVYALHNNKTIFNKAYGTTSFDNGFKVNNDLVYDLASVTKIAATTVSVMKLYDEGKLDINKTLGDYLPYTKGTNKADLVIKDILLHQAGLVPFIPFYKAVIDSTSGVPNWQYFSTTKNENNTLQVANNLFVANSYQAEIQQRILDSKLSAKGKYVYSDNDFIFLGKIVEALSGKSLNNYVEEVFYKPLNMQTTTYLPLQKMDKLKIAPTELEKHFRRQHIWGFVHDEGAAMMGGVAGHAGLFSNAQDLSKLFSMLLNKGSFNGIEFIKPSTIELFTSYQSNTSRRGLGFDKPEKDNTSRKEPYPSKSASAETFGHTGFTGTCVWADPANNLIYIFLSNRVNPTRDNNKLGQLGIRGKIQEAIYDFIKQGN